MALSHLMLQLGAKEYETYWFHAYTHLLATKKLSQATELLSGLRQRAFLLAILKLVRRQPKVVPMLQKTSALSETMYGIV